LASSYGAELAVDFGRRVRNFVSDPLHRQIFPQCVISPDSAAAQRFAIQSGGNYYAVGSGGAITGRGAHVLLLDDLIKSAEVANSATERRNLQNWYEFSAYSRLEEGGVVIIVSTRWHADDLSGWLLREHANEGWKVLSVPAIAEPNDPLDRLEGQPLWPSKFPLSTLERIREAIGTSAWLALYQQRPSAAESNIYRREWWRRYSTPPTEISQIIFSLDTAFKATETADYSVLQIWGETKTGYLLLHVWRARAEFPELKRQAVALAEIWRARGFDRRRGQRSIADPVAQR
jgi:hypothetical protein